MITFRDRFFGCFFGSILGDVLGMPYEFECAGDFYFDGTMEEGGTFNLRRGYYIDYTMRYAELVRDIITEDTNTLDKIREIVDSYDYGEEYEATGYIVNSYYASLRSFANTTSFKDCMIDIINIGGDTDTNACIAGMLAGAYYGFSGLPKEWVYNIHNFEYLYRMCESLLELVQENAQSH